MLEITIDEIDMDSLLSRILSNVVEHSISYRILQIGQSILRRPYEIATRLLSKA